MLEIITLSVSAIAVVLLIVMLIRLNSVPSRQDIEAISRNNEQALSILRTEISTALSATIGNMAEMQTNTQKQIASIQDTRLAQISEQLGARFGALQNTVSDQLTVVEQRMKNNTAQTMVGLENIRATMEQRISSLQTENTKKLDEMRNTVDEKLQKTLDEKLKQSFSMVSERLEQVYKGLGEMQTLAIGVGDLKKVLSNVKTRGILGEIQLGAILEEILSREQYEENIATVRGSSERVEFAVKLPGDGSGTVYLPIDAKFPSDAYTALLDAYDLGDAGAVETAAKALDNRIKGFAKDIHDKYIRVPDTTDFGIMFLPVEGLYAEVVRHGLIEKLQSDYHVVIAGPTTMAALLSSLQMGFRTLAIQERTSEVWSVLGSVKSEFETFAKALEQTQARINQAGSELENLIGVRTRQIQRRLHSVTALPMHELNSENADITLE
ncbi:MAG: DNA recombination protein RmuC [Oscillospiraceae bacterium]